MSGRSYVLTEIVTVGGNNAPNDKVIQDATQWLDVNGAGDATIIVECFALTAPTSGTVVLNIQSSPFFDETTFALAAPSLTLAASATPVILKTVAGVSVAGLARFLRYAITVTGTGSWSVTFRIRVVTNRSSYFRPTQLSGCLLWLRADLGITLSGTSVTAWADQSGGGHDASTSGTSPTYAPTAVNGLPAIQGNGSTQAMKTVAFDAGSNATFITVVQPTTTNEGNTARILEQNNVTSYYLGSTTGGTAYKLIVGDNTPPFGSAETAANTVQQAPSIVSATYAGGAPHGVGTIYYNGAPTTPDSTSFTNPSGGSLAAFLMSSYFGTNFWSGYLAEVLVYQRVLSTTELLRVHRYLGGRYGVTVP